MATKYWIGKADAVAQVSSASIDSVDATPSNNTFTVTIGGEAVTVTGVTSAAATAAALVVALQASTHPYFAAVTWTNPSGGTITGTADTAGVPFLAVLSKAGAGTGTVTDFSDDTACSGPNHWDTAANWSTGTVPVASDDVVIENSSANICWGLEQSAVDLNSLTIKQTYTGKIGLRSTEFATSSDGATLNSSKPEYRSHYLDIESDVVEIGEHFGAGAPSGSGRIKLDLGVHAATVIIHNTARTPTESGLACVRLLLASSSSDVFVRAAPGGVGIAADEGDETSTIRELSVSAQADAEAYVYCSDGVTLTTWTQVGGRCVLSAAATVTTCALKSGTLEVEGAFLVTTLTQDGGVCYLNNVPTSGAAVTTLNLNGGALDMKRSNRDRTITTLNWDQEAGAVFAIDPDVVTITNGIALA